MTHPQGPLGRGYGVTPDELTAVSQAFAGQVRVVAEQTRLLQGNRVNATTTSELFVTEGQAYADLVAMMARCVDDYAAHVDSIAAGLAADARRYAAVEAANTAALREDE